MTREELNKERQEELEQRESKEKRRKIAKNLIKFIFIFTLIISTILCYTRFISTSGLKIKEKRIVSNEIPDSFNGEKIIQFSDLQYGSTVFIDEVDNLVKKINLRNPSIIVFTGDLIDKEYNIKHDEIEKLIKSLSKLNATIGKYAVSGDEDSDNFTTILTQAGFSVLDNSFDLVYNKSNDPLLITGLKASNKNRDINKAFSYFNSENSNKNIYSILLMHEADSIDEVIKNYKVDIAFAGGNLNGQIYIPNLGGLITRKNASKYTKPYYKIQNTNLYISSGIGTDGIKLRFFNKPSINFIRLAK